MKSDSGGGLQRRSSGGGGAGAPNRQRRPSLVVDAVQLDVLRINAIQLSRIDQLSQTFTARYFVHMRIQNGALDPHLVKDIDEKEPTFPKDTLRPGAGWFLRQIEFPTALEYQLSRLKVVRIDEHLDLVLQVNGTFHSEMTLQHFPMDVQNLAFIFVVTCAAEGIVPVKFKLSPDLVASVQKDTFALSNLWRLHNRALVELDVNQPMPETTYPALKVNTLVVRRPVYFLLNVIVPLASLTFLALLQFLLPGQTSGSNVIFRITYSVTILLTTATYKLFIASALPIGLAYMTLLDKYVLFCFLLQVGLVTETAIMGSLTLTAENGADSDFERTVTLTRNEGLPRWSTSKYDFILGCVSVAIFICGQVYFIVYAYWASTVPLQREMQRFDKVQHSQREETIDDDESFTRGQQQNFTKYRERSRSVRSANVPQHASLAFGTPRMFPESDTSRDTSSDTSTTSVLKAGERQIIPQFQDDNGKKSKSPVEV